MQAPRDSLSKCNTDHLFTSIAAPRHPPPAEPLPLILIPKDTLESEEQLNALILSQVHFPVLIKMGKVIFLAAAYPVYVAIYQFPKAILTTILPKVIQEAHQVTVALVNMTQAIFNPVFNTVTKMTQKVQNASLQIAQIFHARVQNATKVIVHRVEEMTQHLPKIFAKTFSKLSFASIPISFYNLVSSAFVKIQEPLQKGIAKVTEKMAQFNHAVQQAIQPMVAWVGIQFNKINHVAYEAAKRLAESIETPLKKASKLVSKGAETVVNTTQQIVQPMILWMTPKVEYVTVYIKEKGEGFGKFCAKKFQQFSQKMIQAYDTTLKFLTPFVSPFWRLLQRLLEQIARWLSALPWERWGDPMLKTLSACLDKIEHLCRQAFVFSSHKVQLLTQKVAFFWLSLLSRFKKAPKSTLHFLKKIKSLSKTISKRFFAWLRVIGQYGKLLLRELALEIKEWR
jgi:hypothetical protein